MVWMRPIRINIIVIFIAWIPSIVDHVIDQCAEVRTSSIILCKMNNDCTCWKQRWYVAGWRNLGTVPSAVFQELGGNIRPNSIPRRSKTRGSKLVVNIPVNQSRRDRNRTRYTIASQTHKTTCRSATIVPKEFHFVFRQPAKSIFRFRIQCSRSRPSYCRTQHCPREKRAGLDHELKSPS